MTSWNGDVDPHVIMWLQNHHAPATSSTHHVEAEFCGLRFIHHIERLRAPEHECRTGDFEELHMSGCNDGAVVQLPGRPLHEAAERYCFQASGTRTTDTVIQAMSRGV